MRADSQALHQEARGVIKDALSSYPGAPIHVAIYALTRRRSWNDLQAELARTDAPSDPEKVSTICTAVEQHLESELRQYLEIGPKSWMT